MRGSVVPFVGAGISRSARVSSVPAFEPNIESSGYLWRRLRARLARELRQSRAHGNTNGARLARGALGLPRQRSFGTMAEVCRWLVGAHELCKALEISRFAQLEPRPAHYAIGCLVLEGLLDEVISTNWDTCLEKALGHLEGRADGGGSGDSTHRVVTSLGSYRRHGARRRRKNGGAVLRLYKINGCAAEYTRDPPSQATAIVVTERQLQDFGERSWARDLLRDRVRSRTLLFSGFGSDEPQVRHTVLQLMDELSRDGHNAPAPEHELFVIAYSATLSFSQQQILRAFSVARGLNGTNIEDAIQERSLTGRSARYFNIEDAGRPGQSELPADHFWCALFEAAIGRLIAERYTKPGFALHSWLSLHSPAPLAVLASLLIWLFPPESHGESVFPCAVPGLFGPHPTQQGFILGRWLRAMGQPNADAACEIPAYCALRDRKEPLLPLAALTTLLFLARLASSRSTREAPTPLSELLGRLDGSSGRGLALRRPAASSDATPGPESVFLVTENAYEADLRSAAKKEPVARTRYEIAVPQSLARHADSRSMIQMGQETRRINRRHRIAASELLSADLRAGWGSLTRLFARREDPSDARRKRRLRRVEEASPVDA